MTTSNYIPVSGNTYPIKDQLKALGGRWNAAQKCWMMPANVADKAFALLQAAPRGYVRSAASQPARRSRGTWTGCSCGSVEEYDRPSDCWSCRFDRDDC